MLADQDDVWLPNKLPLVRELFAGETARPYLVVLDARIVDEEERVVYPSVQAKLHAGPGLVKNIWANRYLGCCMAFSRDLLDVALPVSGRRRHARHLARPAVRANRHHRLHPGDDDALPPPRRQRDRVRAPVPAGAAGAAAGSPHLGARAARQGRRAPRA